MKLLHFFVMFGALSFAQTVDPKKVFDQIKAGHDIARLWNSFGIAPNDAFECHDGCGAEFFFPDFDPEAGPGKTSVLVVTGDFLAAHRILLFHCESACRYLDHIEQEAHDLEIKLSVVLARDRRWLVMTQSTANGTEVGTYGSQWYELRSHKLRHVLTVPDRGYWDKRNEATHMSMRFVRYVRAANLETLEFAYHFEFGIDYQGDLWEDEWTVAFSRDTPGGEFDFDRQRSKIPTGWKLSRVGPSLQDVLSYATERLLKIARNPKDPRRAWLVEWIKTVGDSPEAQQIRAALKASER